MTHGREDGTRWRPLRPSRVTRRFEIWLGGLLWTMPVLAGGAMITESFDTADSDTLGPDLPWTEVRGDWDVVSNQVQCIAGDAGNFEAFARADSNLASDDHYVQAVLRDTSLASGTAGVTCRKDATATYTFYLVQCDGTADPDSWTTYRSVTDTYTQVGGGTSINMAQNDVIRLEADGSSITRKRNGSVQETATDTNITGNLRCGLRSYVAAPWTQQVVMNSFEAADLAAGGATWPGWFHSRGGWTA